MNKFKVGDRVKCTRGVEGGSLSHEPLKTGHVYTVVKVFVADNIPSIVVNGIRHGYLEDRFIKDTEN